MKNKKNKNIGTSGKIMKYTRITIFLALISTVTWFIICYSIVFSENLPGVFRIVKKDSPGFSYIIVNLDKAVGIRVKSSDSELDAILKSLAWKKQWKNLNSKVSRDEFKKVVQACYEKYRVKS
jgi:hypothetical protein